MSMVATGDAMLLSTVFSPFSEGLETSSSVLDDTFSLIGVCSAVLVCELTSLSGSGVEVLTMGTPL